ncbi:hypothetical protein HK099_006109 [Clydaea vesicula]|uniref:Iron-binding zinc finger CDGSH type domain-containing protein n=1 Tax=Clydaea vesicula TaxID=447962 RepID=A0AAD5XUJ0_9FUNG|nr:hypothetical protein HK099_006109 [Clydaea vesicula]
MDIEDYNSNPKYPSCKNYCPFTMRDLIPNTIKNWCTCGLSKNQPWCDYSHIGTSFKPLKWVVPEKNQTLYSICGKLLKF